MPNDFHQELFELSSDLMVVLDRSGLVVEANSAFLSLLGASAQEIKGQAMSQFACAEDQPYISAALQGVSLGSFPQRTESRWMARGHAHIHCDYTFRSSQCGRYILAIGRNLDAWHKSCNAMCRQHQVLERLIAERTRELKLAIGELEAFNLSISHDLRAPLRAINTFSQALAEDCHPLLDGVSQDYLRRIGINCERMMTLIDNLLQLSILGHKGLQRTAVDLGKIADTIIADMQAATPYRCVRFSREDDMLVEGDRTLLFLLLQNLLENAWKYTARCDAAIIHFGVKNRDGARVFSVSDNGVGFPVSQYDKLFTLFQRLHTPEEYDGMGIGLATAKRVVQRHCGRIWAESIEGKGAHFYFTLQTDGAMSLAEQSLQE